jgi:hypothetical protein
LAGQIKILFLVHTLDTDMSACIYLSVAASNPTWREQGNALVDHSPWTDSRGLLGNAEAALMNRIATSEVSVEPSGLS